MITSVVRSLTSSLY